MTESLKNMVVIFYLCCQKWILSLMLPFRYLKVCLSKYLSALQNKTSDNIFYYRNYFMMHCFVIKFLPVQR